MKRLITFFAFSFLLSCAAPTQDKAVNGPTSVDNAGIYLLSKLDLSLDKITALAPGSIVTEESTEIGRKYIVSWSDVTVTINTKKIWDDRAVQVRGMSNWIRSFRRSDAAVQNLLSKIESTSDSIGCVIKPGYDKGGKVSKLVTGIAEDHTGFIFTYQSFYSEAGEKIVGQESDPDRL